MRIPSLTTFFLLDLDQNAFAHAWTIVRSLFKRYLSEYNVGIANSAVRLIRAYWEPFINNIQKKILALIPSDKCSKIYIFAILLYFKVIGGIFVLNELHASFPNVPTMALTATASPKVRQDILKELGMVNCKSFVYNSDCPNLQYIVKEKPKKQKRQSLTWYEQNLLAWRVSFTAEPSKNAVTPLKRWRMWTNFFFSLCSCSWNYSAVNVFSPSVDKRNISN